MTSYVAVMPPRSSAAAAASQLAGATGRTRRVAPTPSTATSRPSRAYVATKEPSSTLPCTTVTSSPPSRRAGELHLPAVLLGPEVRQPGVRRRPAEQGRDGRGRLVQRVRPVLGADRPAGVHVVGERAVADRDDAGCGSRRGRVGVHAAGDRRARCRPARRPRASTPMPTSTTSAGSRVPSASSTASTRPVPTSRATPTPVRRWTPCVGVQPRRRRRPSRRRAARPAASGAPRRRSRRARARGRWRRPRHR